MFINMSQLFIAQYSEECVFPLTCLLQVERFSPPQSLIASRESGMLILLFMVAKIWRKIYSTKLFYRKLLHYLTVFSG